MKKLLVLVLLLFLFLPIDAQTLRYVTKGGNDGNGGTDPITDAWLTIDHAADTVSANTIIYVYEGTYAERVTMATSGGSGTEIIFEVNSGDTVTCQGFTIQASYVEVDGFRIDGTGVFTCNWSATDYGVAIWGSYTYVELRNLYITKNGHAGIIMLKGSTYCTVDSCEMYQCGVAGIDCRGDYHTITNNEVHDPRCAPCDFEDMNGMYFHGDNLVFRGNYIHNLSFSNNPTYSPHADGFQTWADANRNEATNCVFEKNILNIPYYISDTGCSTSWMLEDAVSVLIKNNIIIAFRGVNALTINASGVIKVLNNTFVGDLDFNTSYFPWALDARNSNDLEFKNNIILEQPYAVYMSTGSSGFDEEYNCTYNSDESTPAYQGDAPDVTDLWETDPKVVNIGGTSAEDYKLNSDSPCINAGVNLSGTVDDDYDGISRPKGTDWDMGAYEYGPNVLRIRDILRVRNILRIK